ncbi:MAG: phosphatidylinositol-specific phospholipase C/glycerophosphodiester phosphodiesterase family protein [Saprospiraceae bacterium]|nr:phosphatidylinositol-specific phospholipase C/glycerophosphodiester phosphodiesterase family protein [Saprospiraceae bacterium]
MQNEKHLPTPRRGRWPIRNYWQSSLLLLIVPSFHSDRAVDFSSQNREPLVASVALPNAHAHNDYLHDNPLWEALSKGFTSIEADVHLVGGELYLGHWLPQMFPAKTLREVYLEPLSKLLASQNGKIYPAYDGVFYLMVDVKTDSLATYRVLRQQLLQYPLFQCNPHFQVFVSGNRAVQHILNDAEEVAAVDGRLPDLSKNFAASAMPVVSDNFKKHFKWRGKGAMPAQEKSKLERLAHEAHRQGKKLRFWAIPDQPNAWLTLLEAGVDLISTDDLEGAEQFLLGRN